MEKKKETRGWQVERNKLGNTTSRLTSQAAAQPNRQISLPQRRRGQHNAAISTEKGQEGKQKDQCGVWEHMVKQNYRNLNARLAVAKTEGHKQPINLARRYLLSWEKETEDRAN